MDSTSVKHVTEAGRSQQAGHQSDLTGGRGDPGSDDYIAMAIDSGMVATALKDLLQYVRLPAPGHSLPRVGDTQQEDSGPAAAIVQQAKKQLCWLLQCLEPMIQVDVHELRMAVFSLHKSRMLARYDPGILQIGPLARQFAVFQDIILETASHDVYRLLVDAALAGDATTKEDELFRVASRVGELLDQAEVARVKIRRELAQLLPTVTPASATRIGG